MKRRERTARVLLRLTPDEKRRWSEAANQHDLYDPWRRGGLSEFIRQAVNDRVAAMKGQKPRTS